MLKISEYHDPRSSFYAVAAALWLVGFGFALMPLEAYEAESFLLAVLCVGACVICVLAMASLSALRRAIVSTWIVWLALGFWALAGLSVALSEIPFVSFIYFCFLSVFPLSAFLVAACGGSSALLKPLGYGAAAVFGGLALSCLAQYFFMSEMLFYGVVSWPLANPNSLAGLLSLGFFAAMGWMLALSGRGQSNVALVLAALLAAAILTTGSRGAMVAMIPALGVFLWGVRAHLGRHKRCLGALVGACILAFVAMGALSPLGAKSPASIIETTLSGAQSALWNRPAIWASALQIFREHVWSGTGIGTFFLYYPEVRSVDDPSTAGLMVHSDPLQFAVEMGAFAPIVFYSFILMAIWMSVRALKKLPLDDVRRVYILTPFCALMALVIHAHITFHFHVLSILMVAGALLGFWFLQVSAALHGCIQENEEPYCNPCIRWALAFPVVGVLAIFSQFQASEILVSRAQNGLMVGAGEAYANKINRAGRLSYNQNARALVAATHLPLGIVQLNAPLMPRDDLQALEGQLRSLLDRAERTNPRLAQIYFARAEMAATIQPFLAGQDLVHGRYDVAEELRKALALDPLHLGSRMKLADLFLRRRRNEEALEILGPGLNWRYKTQRPRLFLEKTYGLARQLERDDIAEKAAIEFARYFPQEKLSGMDGENE
ncbi:MAG: O-antigen ligase family protein [Alphaproteobacteria bacterium]|nr:O-antigen ligase family protein [Alphaproteobacteria bacterium]